jgi:para-aminobenzoate synthetase component 1
MVPVSMPRRAMGRDRWVAANLGPAEHARAGRAVRAAIGRGDVYQVNLVQHLSATFAGSPRSLAARLAPLTQSNELPFADAAWRVFEGHGWAIVTVTPELFLARRGDRVWTRPIKGTRPRGIARSSSRRRRTPPST